MSFVEEFKIERYACIWFAELCNHIALISPVTRKVMSSSELLAAKPFHVTVVSGVFGYVFSNSRNTSGSLMTSRMRLIAPSTAEELRVRHPGAGH